MKKLYDKSPLGFSLVWIGIYVVVMNIALQVCGGFDHLETKTVRQLLVPVVCISILAITATVWVRKQGLENHFGLCRLAGTCKAFLWFIPLILMSCVNLKNGLCLCAPLPVSLLMALNLALGGYVEELIFRGFLFRAMEKEKLSTAIIVSAVTFGAGHIVNLGNTADTFGVLLQVCYAIVIGFLYTVITYTGGSLWPCIISHMFVNATSVFSPNHGPFTALVESVFGQDAPWASQVCSAALIMILSGSYALWLWNKHNSFQDTGIAGC